MAFVKARASRAVAKMPGVRDAVRAQAETVLGRAVALAAAHRLTGSYTRSLKLVRPADYRSFDWLVVSDDPQALAIEFGAAPHTIGRGDAQIRHPGSPPQRILTQAAAG